MVNKIHRTLALLFLITIISVLRSSLLYSQTFLDLGIFPLSSNDEPVSTKKFLELVKWNELIHLCNQDTDNDNNCWARIYYNEDSSKISYQFHGRKCGCNFFISSYKDMMMEFTYFSIDVTKPVDMKYFDKKVYMRYVNDKLPDLDPKFRLADTLREEILRGYYTLLGVDASFEYGWVCEYSTVGLLTDMRKAVVNLISNDQKDLLLLLLEYPVVETQMYAADALIYQYYYDIKNQIKEFNDDLAKDPQAETDEEYIEYLKGKLLTKKEWEKIYKIRDSGKIVRTCGNSGSFKIYPKNTSDLLSEEAIKELPAEYEALKVSYFR